MLTSASMDPKARGNLLVQAVELANALNIVLERIGKNRFIRSTLVAGSKKIDEAFRRMYEMEDALQNDLRRATNSVTSPSLPYLDCQKTSFGTYSVPCRGSCPPVVERSGTETNQDLPNLSSLASGDTRFSHSLVHSLHANMASGNFEKDHQWSA